MHVGDILNNKYILVKNIGNGQFSEVWLSINYTLNTYVAIKIFDEDNLDMGLTEIEILKKITNTKCEYCISYIEHFKFNGIICIVQKLMAGSLYTIMKSQYPNGFPISIVGMILRDLLKALIFIHDKLKIIHADIKPENILLVGHSIEVDQIIKTIDLPEKPCKSKGGINKLALKIKKIYNEPKNTKQDTCESSEISCDSNMSDILTSDSDTYSINTDSDIASSHSSTISRSYLDSDISECDNSEKDNIQIVDQKYLINPHIVLADFGNCIQMESDHVHGYGDIQTRHYRSPEIILRLLLNEKIDIWALGCTLYELMTGKVLFDPHKTIDITTDVKQLYDMQCLLGLFPKYFYTGRKNNIFFKDNYFLKKFDDISVIDFKQLFKNNVKEYISNECLEKLYKIISDCLIYDISKRPSASQLADYPI